MSDYTSLRYDVGDGIGHITLCRPEKHNSLDLTQCQELEDVTGRIVGDRGVRAVLFDAEGPTFHVGGDLGFFAGLGDGTEAMLQRLTMLIHTSVARLTRGRAPVVIAVQGMAAGGGMSLALGGDIVLAGESAKFTMAYTAAALTPDATSSWFLPRLVGLRRAQELIYTNRRLSAHEAFEWGIVTEVVNDEVLRDRAREVAEQIAAGPTEAYAGVKRLLRSTFGNSLEEQMFDEGDLVSRAAASRDGREGIDAFLNKRRPSFTGE